MTCCLRTTCARSATPSTRSPVSDGDLDHTAYGRLLFPERDVHRRPEVANVHTRALHHGLDRAWRGDEASQLCGSRDDDVLGQRHRRPTSVSLQPRALDDEQAPVREIGGNGERHGECHPVVALCFFECRSMTLENSLAFLRNIEMPKHRGHDAVLACR